jgi:hypothetical protein
VEIKSENDGRATVKRRIYDRIFDAGTISEEENIFVIAFFCNSQH